MTMYFLFQTFFYFQTVKVFSTSRHAPQNVFDLLFNVGCKLCYIEENQSGIRSTDWKKNNFTNNIFNPVKFFVY